MQSHDATSTYVHLAEGPDVSVIPVTDDFWATIHERTELHTGRLVMATTVDADWNIWEMHPDGDELIVVTEGRVRLHLDDGHAVSQVTVDAPQFVVMPAGTWHTADSLGPARLLIVTWGEGTEHRAR